MPVAIHAKERFRDGLDPNGFSGCWWLLLIRGVLGPHELVATPVQVEWSMCWWVFLPKDIEGRDGPQ